MNNLKLINSIVNPGNKCNVIDVNSRSSSSERRKSEQRGHNALPLSILRSVAMFLAVASVAFFTQFASAQAEHVANADPYTLRANTLRSEFIPDTVASEHNLDAGPDRGVLNVVVQRKMPSGKNATVPAEVIAYQRNLVGQRKTIEMQTVQANDQITYLGTFDFGYSKNLHFVVEATPKGSEETITLEFEEEF